VSAPEIAPRDVPYPYAAMLAVCSDLDATPDWRVYRETMRYLNTTAGTPWGPGLGLEVGNSVYFDMPAREFAYWNTDDCGRQMLRSLIRSGHVDCLHSFGGLAATRAHAQRALDELVRHDCRIEVWTDHSVAPTNFGADIMRGQGDDPSSPAYHADLTCPYGVEFVWRGRVTSVIAQDAPRTLRGIYDRGHPRASALTLAKEAAKGLLGRAGHPRYAVHAANEVLRPARLRDGRPVWEFLRANPHWAGVGRGESAAGLADALGERTLFRLVAGGGKSVVYTHLGKIERKDEPLGAAARAALRRVAELARAGRLLVTTTRRLLGYCRSQRDLRVEAARTDERWTVSVTTGAPPAASSRSGVSDLDGLTVYVPDPARTRLIVDGRERSDARANPPDHTGRPSLSLPWPRLEFPDLGAAP
jgi:hypothetical protein